MKVDYSYKATNWLDKAPQQLRKRIMEKMWFYASQEDPLSFATYIPEKLAYRFRVGDYRTLCKVEDNMLKVAKVERRDKAYD